MSYLKKSFLCTIVLSLCVTYSNAQSDNNSTRRVLFSLSGKITDSKSGTALPGTTILIHELNKGTVATDDGSYSISNIPPGKYLIEVSYVGYSPDVQTVSIRSESEQNFALQQTAVEQEAVIVTGVSSAT